MTDVRQHAPNALTAPLRYALLALLAEGECHGYGLMRRFEARVGPFWNPNVGQVYALLRQLADRGLATCRTSLGDSAARGGPKARVVYRITEKGRRVLRQWLDRRPQWPPPPRGEIFVRLMAAEAEGPLAMRAQLDRYAAEFGKYHEQLRTWGALHHPVARIVLEAALAEAAAHERWLTRARAALDVAEAEAS